MGKVALMQLLNDTEAAICSLEDVRNSHFNQLWMILATNYYGAMFSTPNLKTILFLPKRNLKLSKNKGRQT